MLKYWLVIIFNTPLAIASMLLAVTAYRQGRLSRARLLAWILFWLVVIVGIMGAEPGYKYLQDRHWTDSTPLSLFDLLAITGVITSLALLFRVYSKLDSLERKLIELNKNTSLRLSDSKKTKIS